MLSVIYFLLDNLQNKYIKKFQLAVLLFSENFFICRGFWGGGKALN